MSHPYAALARAEMEYCPSMLNVVSVWYPLLVLGTGLSSAGDMP